MSLKRQKLHILTTLRRDIQCSAVAGLKLLGGPNLHFYCSTLVFNIYFLEFAKLLGGPGPPRPLPTLRHCNVKVYLGEVSQSCSLHILLEPKKGKYEVEGKRYRIKYLTFLTLINVYSNYHQHSHFWRKQISNARASERLCREHQH